MAEFQDVEVIPTASLDDDHAAYFGTYRPHVADGAAVTVYVPLTLQQIDATIAALSTTPAADADRVREAFERIAGCIRHRSMDMWNDIQTVRAALKGTTT